MRRPVLISLSLIMVVATSVALYLLFYDVGDDLELDGDLVRSTTLVVRNPRKGVRKTKSGNKGLVMGLQVRLRDLVDTHWGTGDVGTGAHAGANLDLLVARHYNLLILTPSGAGGLRRAIEEPQTEQTWERVVAEAHRRGLTVYGDVSSLLQVPSDSGDTEDVPGSGSAALRKPSEATVAQAVSQLLDGLRLDGVLAKGLPPSYAVAVHQVTLLRGKSYVHVGDSPKGNADVLMADDWGADSMEVHGLRATATTQPTSAPLATGTPGVTPTFGYSMAVLSHARGFQRRGWSRISSRSAAGEGAALNLALLQAVQFGLDGCVWLAEDAEAAKREVRSGRVEEFVQEMIRLRAGDTADRPLANLVLALPSEERARLEGSRLVRTTAGPVINGLALAGYDVRTTYGAPLEGAAAFAVLAVGRTDRVAMEAPKHLLELLDRDEPVLFVVSGLARFGQWRSALSRLGVRSSRGLGAAVRPLPTARFGDDLIRWHDPVQPLDRSTTRIVPVSAVSGEVEVTADVDGVETALVVRTGNKVLVNGSGLDLETSFVFNRLVKPTLHRPFAGLGTVGRRSAFFALRRTQLLVDLPVAEGSELRLIRFGPDGRPQPVEVVPYQPPFSAAMQAHELLIVEAGSG